MNLEAFSFKQGGDSPVLNWNSGHKQTKNEQTQLSCEQRFLSGMAFCIKFFFKKLYVLLFSCVVGLFMPERTLKM